MSDLLVGLPRGGGKSRCIDIDWLLIEAAREWLLDCEFPDLSRAEIWDMDDEAVRTAVRRHWSGGWDAFAADNEKQVAR